MAQRTDRIDVKKLVAATVTEFMDSETFLEWLRFRASFYTYSWNNQLLIWAQMPEATMVAGFKKWLSLNRCVRRGEHGLQIVAPIVREDEETGERKVKGFRPTYVFDISQTDGPEVPELPYDRLTRITDDAITDCLVNFAVGGGTTVITDDTWLLEHDALGMYDRQRNVIAIRSDLDEAIWQHTLAHEIMHRELRTHMKEADTLGKAHHETLAETGALMVMTALGFDIDPGSVSYIASYAQDPELFLSLINLADKFSKPIITALEAVTEDIPV